MNKRRTDRFISDEDYPVVNVKQGKPPRLSGRGCVLFQGGSLCKNTALRAAGGTGCPGRVCGRPAIMVMAVLK